MFYRPFDIPLSEVTVEDVASLVERQIPEGIALEYKSQWVPDKIARAVAAMANNVGGTVVVGMETEELLPINFCGFATPGDPAEMVVQVIRDHIAPVPDFRPLSLELKSGEKALVVEVEEGTNPPYLLTKTGQIVVRTPTSSTPGTREDVQAMFEKGERGREWAETQVMALQPVMTVGNEVHLATVPSVAGGLSLNPSLFRKSTLEALDERTPVPFAHPANARRWDLRPDRSVVMVDFERIHAVELEVRTSGLVHSTWKPLSQPPDYNMAESLLSEGLGRHAQILEEVFAYRGSAFVAFGGHLAQGLEQNHHFHPWVRRGPVALPRLKEAGFREEICREIARTVQLPDFEPEV